MVQLIKKGGLRERANRSRSYKGSENTEATLQPNRYQASLTDEKTTKDTALIITEDAPTTSSADQSR